MRKYSVSTILMYSIFLTIFLVTLSHNGLKLQTQSGERIYRLSEYDPPFLTRMSTSDSFTHHHPIEINSDSELEAVAVSGKGTKNAPYILKGWKITTLGIDGIYIRHTTTHFIIKNCWIETGGKGSAISIGITANGTVRIENNFCYNNKYGIFVHNSNASKIKHNICIQNSIYGIEVENLESPQIINNTCVKGELGNIQLSGTYNSVVSENICVQSSRSGITSSMWSIGSILTNNLLAENHDYGIYTDSGSNTIYRNTFLNNGLDSKKTSQAYQTSHNTWYNRISQEGNYWSDYNGVGSYLIAGSTQTSDPYPLKEPLHEYIPSKYTFSNLTPLNVDRNDFLLIGDLRNWIVYPLGGILAISNGMFLAWIYEKAAKKKKNGKRNAVFLKYILIKSQLKRRE